MSASIFETALEHFGVDFKSNRRSIILRHCPNCGKSKNSVWMFRPDENSGRTGGQCWKCGFRFSSYSYLIAMGMEAKEILKKLGISRHSPDLNPESWKIHDFETENEVLQEAFAPTQVDVPMHFIKAGSYLEHAAAKYAISRGAVWPLCNQIYVDPLTNAVAFQIHCSEVRVGFQRRYVKPTGHLKTITDSNVPRAKSFITFGADTDPICVVEGPFDAIAAVWFGFQGIATMGASISRSQGQELAMLAIERNPDRPAVFIGFDADSAGEKGARELAKLLDAYGVSVLRVRPEHSCNDLNSVLTKHSGVVFSDVEEVFTLPHTNLITVSSDWAWDLPMLEEYAFLALSNDWKQSQMNEYRAVDKTVTNDYNWKDFKTDTSSEAKNRNKRWNKIKREDPDKHRKASLHYKNKQKKVRDTI